VGAGTLAAAISGLATSLGALPFLFVRDLPRRAYDGILGLGAGLMLAAATLGLLGEAVHDLRADDGTLALGRLALVVLGFGSSPTSTPAATTSTSVIRRGTTSMTSTITAPPARPTPSSGR